MSLYIVEVEKLSHSKFGILKKGEKFNADEKAVSELLKNKSVKLAEKEPQVKQYDEAEYTDETDAVKSAAKKKGKK